MCRLVVSCVAFALFAALVCAPSAAQPAGQTKPGETLTDEEVLKKANLAADDGPALVAYLKQRTVSDADQGRIKELIKKFSADSFDERLEASYAIEKFGPAAIGPLKAVERDPDAEVAYRAKLLLRKLEQVPHSAVAGAAVRGVVRLKPPGAVGALIGFLPLADGEAQADDIRAGLLALAAPGGKPDPDLLAALTDPSPVRRGAAYVALTEGGPATERVRIPEAIPLVRDAVRKDADPDAKFRGLWSLLVTTREKEFVPDLIGLTAAVPHNRLRQIEDLLLHLAGEHPPGGRFGKTPDERAKARDVWAAWWGQKGGAADLVKFPFVPKVRGFTEIVELDLRYGQGRVVCLGPDMKEKWRVTQVSHAADARVLPNGRVLIADMNVFRVGEWTPTATEPQNVKVTQTQPVSVAVLPDGGTLIVSRGGVAQYNAVGVRVFEYFRPTADIQAGARLPNGETVFVTLQQQPNVANCFRLDAKGKEVGKPITLRPVQDAHTMDVVGDDRILIAEPQHASEYDLKTGKLVWKYDLDHPTSLQRLPNGNTLMASLNGNRAVEVDPEGKVVWEYAAEDQLRVSRIYHR